MIAILSDIHPNLETLVLALAALAKENITKIYCTIDLVQFPEAANKDIGFGRFAG